MSTASPRYRILSSLGKGGMGEVFLAEDSILERKVAIKFLPKALQHDPVARGRFEREAKSAAALDHPFICKIYEFGEVDGRACIVMEHVAGQTLESRLADGPLAPAEAIQIALEVSEALTEAHSRRILHRDLKPANLMLTEHGHVKVMDFGLAKRMPDPGGSDSEDLTLGSLTQTGAVLGTPAYMAPEQVRGEPTDARSDIFSFGVVLVELLTGEHPFKRGSVSETVAAILRDPPSRAEGGAIRPTTPSSTSCSRKRPMIGIRCSTKCQSRCGACGTPRQSGRNHCSSFPAPVRHHSGTGARRSSGATASSPSWAGGSTGPGEAAAAWC